MTLDQQQRLELAERLRRLATPDVPDALDQLGQRDQTALGINRLWDDCPRIAGRRCRC